MLVRDFLKLATLQVGSRGWGCLLECTSAAQRCLPVVRGFSGRACIVAGQPQWCLRSPLSSRMDALLKILGDPFRGQARCCVPHSLRMGGGFNASCSPFPTMPLSALGGLLLALAGSACGAPLRATQAEAGASPRWYAVDQPPLVAGIRLGDSLAHVRSVLGSPTEYRRLVGGAHELVYWPPGLAVITTDAQGVALIGLLSPEAPEVAGVRVGDPVPHLVQRWGPPHRRSSQRPERISSITFAWSSKATPSSITPPWPGSP
jgi:hypothetical protein